MNLSYRQEFQQITINQSSYINLREQDHIFFIQLYRILPLDKSLCFRRNLLGKSCPWQLIEKLEMTKCDLILIKKQQKYQYYHQANLINMKILQLNKYYLLIESQNCKNLNLLIYL